MIVNSNNSSRNTCDIVNHNNTNGDYSGNKTNTANKSTNTANKATNTSSSKASTSKSAKLLVTSQVLKKLTHLAIVLVEVEYTTEVVEDGFRVRVF